MGKHAAIPDADMSREPRQPGREGCEDGPWIDVRRYENRKYQYMESNMQRKAAGLQDKIPDIQKTLETVQFLKTRTVCHQAGLPAPCP